MIERFEEIVNTVWVVKHPEMFYPRSAGLNFKWRYCPIISLHPGDVFYIGSMCKRMVGYGVYWGYEILLLKTKLDEYSPRHIFNLRPQMNASIDSEVSSLSVDFNYLTPYCRRLRYQREKQLYKHYEVSSEYGVI